MVRLRRRTAQTIVYLTGDGLTAEVGTAQRLLFLDNMLIEYENEPPKDFWRWTTVTVYGYFGNGDLGQRSWKNGINTDMPEWLVGLIYTYIPEHRRVR